MPWWLWPDDADPVPAVPLPPDGLPDPVDGTVPAGGLLAPVVGVVPDGGLPAPVEGAVPPDVPWLPPVEGGLPDEEELPDAGGLLDGGGLLVVAGGEPWFDDDPLPPELVPFEPDLF